MTMQNVSVELEINPKEIAKSWKLFLSLGLFMSLLGMAGIVFSVSMTLTTVLFFGFLLLFGGVALVVTGFKGGDSPLLSKKAHFLLGFFYVLLALIFLLDPFGAAAGLTLLVAIWLGVLGVGRIMQFFSGKKAGIPVKGRLLQGVLNLLLGLLLAISWPISGLWAIGIFVGVELLIQGSLLTSAALLMRKSLKEG